MEIEPRIVPRERTLAIGAQGTGKSNAILSVAARCPGSTFYVIDNDIGSYEMLLAEQYPELTNVEIYNLDGDDWQGHLDAVAEIGQRMETYKVGNKTVSDDWCVLDMMTATWQGVQSWFTEQVFGKEIEDYFLEVRMMKSSKKQAKGKEGKSDVALAAFEGFLDWPVINKQYNKLYVALLKIPGHVYATAEIAKIEESTDSKDIKNVYGPYGVKPKGQKRMGHVFHSVLLFKKTRVGEYTMTSCKQRGRDEFEDMEFGDWSKDYLMKIAGWRPKRGG